ncbi:hypothetical protein M758_8G168600 [Ceratodon purpureus]|uniref:GATA-type domain-containing protein n=1 Tax=Ceratodon purpureus TaxID=3225 RepID=A0A8T0GZF1_CERPU|nr:hypothetical protein KC19_8G173700 [Ceratodon purpureus]KAG0609233.1 hypothetical protein M758_8G168600 [Ceratodon purpureus]
MVGVVQCDRSDVVKPIVKGSAKGMEEPSFCNLSLAVDCTLSLGSTTTRTDNPARLSRAGSPDHDLPWSLSVRSDRVDPSRRADCEQDRSEQDNLSWGGSCNRSDSEVSPGYYPQVSERGAQGERRGFKAWPRSSAQSYKDEVNTSKALFSMIEDHKYSNRASRQPWLSNYVPSNAAVEAKVSSRVEQCMEGDSFVRVCAHCGTSKTPLWRNGPGGPKSLCNACGIRFKKAGRRSAANGGSDSQVSPPVSTKVAKRKLNDDQQYWMFPADAKPRKRSRGTAIRTSDSLLSGSCMTWQSSLLAYDLSKSPRQREFPASPLSHSEELKLNLELGSFSSDEEEGAVLLMALSCGMVNA